MFAMVIRTVLFLCGSPLNRGTVCEAIVSFSADRFSCADHFGATMRNEDRQLQVCVGYIYMYVDHILVVYISNP
jgi:hypothetical protein